MIEESPDFRALAALVAIADHGSFRAAAEALGYTQSAVSHQIAALEKTLDGQVFDRPGGRGQVRLTAFGELTYRHAQRILAATRALKADAVAAGEGIEGTLRIGTTETACYLLAGPLAQLARHSSGVDVSIFNMGTSEALIRRLTQGQVDIGFHFNVDPDDRIVTLPILEDAWTLIARRDDPITHKSTIGVEALDGASMIAWHTRWQYQSELEQSWRRRGVAPRIVYRTDDNMMIRQLVLAGLGFAVLGALSVHYLVDDQLGGVPIRNELPPRTISLCYPRDRELSPAALFLMDAVRDLSPPANVRRIGVI